MMYSNQLVCSVKVNGKILREKILDGNSTVLIPFGSEYSLIFKNLAGRNAVVHVEIDGRDINASKQGFYLQAGRTAELEGFEKNYKTERKFKFIQKTEEISDFRGDKIDDGMVRITWQFEKEKQEVIKKTVIHEEHVHHYHNPWHYHWYGCSCPSCNPWIGRITFGKGCSIGSSGDSIGGSVTGENKGNYTLTNSLKSENINYNAQMSNNSDGNELMRNIVKCANVGKTENLLDGITVEGSKSNQSFGTANPKELEENVHSIVILLKGCKEDKTYVAKPVTVDMKKFCPSCGRKYKGNFEYCSQDGTALQGD